MALEKICLKCNSKFVKGINISLPKWKTMKYCSKPCADKGRIGMKLSEETKQKISESNKGHLVSEETRKKLSIANSGHIMSDEQKLKLSKLLTGKKSKLKGKPKMSQRGEKHWNWKGGITSVNRLRRNTIEWFNWRKEVFERDNYSCQNISCNYCNNKRGVELHPHHIKQIKDYPELIYHISNGITLCSDYHLKSGLHKIIGEVV